MLKKLLFKIAKGPFMGKVVGNGFRFCAWAIPVKKVHSSKEIIAFYHPQPSYEHHMILSPKRAIKNLQQMAFDPFSKYFVKIWETVKAVCATRPAYNGSFTLVANGGKRQEVQQVHFHLFTNHEMVNEYAGQAPEESAFYHDRNICVLKYPNPNWEVHFVATPASSQAPENEKGKYTYFKSVLQSIDAINDKFNIVQKGYSLVYRHSKQKSDQERPIFHIVSGKKLH